MKIGYNIRRIRREKEVTQSKLAECIGVRQTTVSSWERGEKEPRAGRLEQIARVLKVEVAELFNGKGG